MKRIGQTYFTLIWFLKKGGRQYDDWVWVSVW